MTTRRKTMLGAAGVLAFVRSAAAAERPVVVNAHHTG